MELIQPRTIFNSCGNIHNKGPLKSVRLIYSEQCFFKFLHRPFMEILCNYRFFECMCRHSEHAHSIGICSRGTTGCTVEIFRSRSTDEPRPAKICARTQTTSEWAILCNGKVRIASAAWYFLLIYDGHIFSEARGFCARSFCIITRPTRTRPTLERRSTLGRLLSINPHMINHFASQS